MEPGHDSLILNSADVDAFAIVVDVRPYPISLVWPDARDFSAQPNAAVG